MDENQEQFISWIAAKLQATDETDLQKKLKSLGDAGIKQAYDQFLQEGVQSKADGGKLDYIRKLQAGGRTGMQALPTQDSVYTSPIKGDRVTDADVKKMAAAGMDFGTKQNYGAWLDTWGSQPSLQQNVASQAVMPPAKMIRRYNQQLRSWETIPAQQVMMEPNSVQVGQPGAWGKWDTSQYKQQITPQDTIGMPQQVRQNVQSAWNMQKHEEGGTIQTLEQRLEYVKCLQQFKKGGKMADCGCGGKLNLQKAQDGAKLQPSFKGKAVGGLNPKKVIMGQGVDGVMGGKPTLKRQLGGTIDRQTNDQTNTQQGLPSKQNGGVPQQPTPEQILDQKVDMKANSILNKKKGVGDALTPMNILMAQLQPKQIKAKPEKRITLMTKDDVVFGVEKKQKGGLVQGGTSSVKKFQAMLNKHGFSLAEDGAWGKATQQAYEQYLAMQSNENMGDHSKLPSLSEPTKQSNNKTTPPIPMQYTTQKAAFPGIASSVSPEHTPQIPQSGVVIDKRTGKGYIIKDGTTRSFPVLTGANVEGNKNDRPENVLTSMPFEERSTPVGYYNMTNDLSTFNKLRYNGKGMNMTPISAYGQTAPEAVDLQIHKTSNANQRDALYNTGSINSYASNGCINCRKEDIENVMNTFPNGDTILVADSKSNKYRTMMKELDRRVMSKALAKK